MSTNVADNPTSILMTPGIVNKANQFSINYVTEDGSPFVICKLQEQTVGLTTLRSPSGSGKTTLLQKFVNYLKENHSGTSEELGFVVSRGVASFPSSLVIGKVPQNPSIVKHWYVSSILPRESSFGEAAFLKDKWFDIYNRQIGELSGGQQRRVYALSVLEQLIIEDAEQAIIVMDETLDGLGSVGAGEFINRISKEWVRKSKSKSLHILLVTHLSNIKTTVTESVSASLSIVDETQFKLTVLVS